VHDGVGPAQRFPFDRRAVPGAQLDAGRQTRRAGTPRQRADDAALALQSSDAAPPDEARGPRDDDRARRRQGGAAY
jgi:hypothetical protein